MNFSNQRGSIVYKMLANLNYFLITVKANGNKIRQIQFCSSMIYCTYSKVNVIIKLKDSQFLSGDEYFKKKVFRDISSVYCRTKFKG